MSENGKKCRLVFPKARNDVLKCLVLSKNQIYSVYCHRGGKKPGNIIFKKLESENFDLFSLKSTQTSSLVVLWSDVSCQLLGISRHDESKSCCVSPVVFMLCQNLQVQSRKARDSSHPAFWSCHPSELKSSERCWMRRQIPVIYTEWKSSPLLYNFRFMCTQFLMQKHINLIVHEYFLINGAYLNKGAGDFL